MELFFEMIEMFLQTARVFIFYFIFLAGRCIYLAWLDHHQMRFTAGSRVYNDIEIDQFAEQYKTESYAAEYSFYQGSSPERDEMLDSIADAVDTMDKPEWSADNFQADIDAMMDEDEYDITDKIHIKDHPFAEEFQKQHDNNRWRRPRQAKTGDKSSAENNLRVGHFGKNQPVVRKPNFNGDSYAVLGLNEGCSASEINSAYRRWIKVYHPDHVAHLGEVEVLRAKRYAQLLTDARSALLAKLAA